MNILKLFSKTSFNVPEMNHFRASKLRFIFKKAGRINDWIRLKLCQTSSLWFIQWQKNWFKVMPVECESQWGGRVGRTLARTHARTHTLAHTNTYTGNTLMQHMQNAQQGLREGSCSVLQTVGDEAETSGCPVEVDRFIDTYRNSKSIIALLIVLLWLPFLLPSDLIHLFFSNFSYLIYFFINRTTIVLSLTN